MDPIQTASIFRAQQALHQAFGQGSQRIQVKAFVDAARTILRSGNQDPLHALRECQNTTVQKSTAHLATDAEWDAASGEMAAAFLNSIAGHSIIDSIKIYGRALPAQTSNVLIASDAVGNVVAEGDPKPVKHLDLIGVTPEPTKAVALAVLSEELARATGSEAERLFEAELIAATVRASNASILSELVDSNTPTITGSGDPLSDLRLGLAAASSSYGYVVVMPAGMVAALATCAEAAPGFTVRGGEFRGGVHVIAVDGADETTVIPASRIALWDDGLKLRSARHASVDLRGSFEDDPVYTSLWQNNLLGLLVERSWTLATADGVVVVEQPEG